MPVHEPGVYILTGPVRSGKTSSLLQWAEKRRDVAGILSPVINGKRIFLDLQSKEQFLMEAEENEKDALNIGHFRFSKKGFDKAIKIIRDGIVVKGWLVIDEIGPLELGGEGFHDVLKDVLAGRTGKTLLVVRENDDMPERVKAKFDLAAAASISSSAAL